jgi:hypothetical protein
MPGFFFAAKKSPGIFSGVSYRNRERFKAAIMFHLGGLDLYPAPSPAHSKA